jgi:rSAM-associated Gly-rich repeat protein
MAKRSRDRRSVEALANLLPAGVMSLSMGLAAADAAAATSASDAPPSRKSVAGRLEEIRGAVSEAWRQALEQSEPYVAVDPRTRLAWWGNGWRNGGWHNGGWHNGGWGNGGWHNGGWGNGGWHNGGWGNGWHNGGWGNGGLLGSLLTPLVGSPWGNAFRNW